MNRNVDLNEMKQYGDKLFHNGFSCAEAVIYTLNKFYDIGLTEKEMSMCSGFPWGLGGGGCICGALASASMVLSHFFGRKSETVGRDDKCFEINNRLHNMFKEKNGATCCRILMKGLDRNDDRRKAYCSSYVSNTFDIMYDLMKEVK